MNSREKSRLTDAIATWAERLAQTHQPIVMCAFCARTARRPVDLDTATADTATPKQRMRPAHEIRTELGQEVLLKLALTPSPAEAAEFRA